MAFQVSVKTENSDNAASASWLREYRFSEFEPGISVWLDRT